MAVQLCAKNYLQTVAPSVFKLVWIEDYEIKVHSYSEVITYKAKTT